MENPSSNADPQAPGEGDPVTATLSLKGSVDGKICITSSVINISIRASANEALTIGQELLGGLNAFLPNPPNNTEVGSISILQMRKMRLRAVK